jgi:hypothetical protein
MFLGNVVCGISQSEHASPWHGSNPSSSRNNKHQPLSPSVRVTNSHLPPPSMPPKRRRSEGDSFDLGFLSPSPKRARASVSPPAVVHLPLSGANLDRWNSEAHPLSSLLSAYSSSSSSSASSGDNYVSGSGCDSDSTSRSMSDTPIDNEIKLRAFNIHVPTKRPFPAALETHIQQVVNRPRAETPSARRIAANTQSATLLDEAAAIRTLGDDILFESARDGGKPLVESIPV